MTRAPFIVIDGKPYRWKDVLDLRRAQLAAAEAAQGSQLALFATLHDDRRSPAARTAAASQLRAGAETAPKTVAAACDLTEWGLRPPRFSMQKGTSFPRCRSVQNSRASKNITETIFG
jgi:hypothetical protein